MGVKVGQEEEAAGLVAVIARKQREMDTQHSALFFPPLLFVIRKGPQSVK